MSTAFRVYEDGDGREVWVTERSTKYDLDLSGYPSDEDDDVLGPQMMSDQEALKLAAGIIYAVWCSYPDEAEALVEDLSADIPAAWNYTKRKP